jgi:hypothetical protein
VHSTRSTPGTPASSIIKTGRHDIAEILLKVALRHKKSINKDHLFVAIFTVITTLDVYMFTTAGVRCNKMKNKTFHTVGTVTKSNRKIFMQTRGKINTPKTYMRDRSLSCLDTSAAIKCGRVLALFLTTDFI